MLCSAPLAQSEVYLGRGRADVTERLRGSLFDKKPLPCLVCGLADRDNNAQRVWIRDRQCAVDSLVGSIVQCGLPPSALLSPSQQQRLARQITIWLPWDGRMRGAFFVTLTA